MNEPTSTFYVKANEFEFSFTKEEIDAADMIRQSPVEFNLLKDHRSVTAKLVEANRANRQLTIEVDGEPFVITIREELDLLLDKMGYGMTSNKQVKEIKAPMPGLVLEIAVTEGQEVAEGEKLLILAAMKMENSIVIQTHARIKRIVVAAGQAVEKGQVLIELE